VKRNNTSNNGLSAAFWILSSGLSLTSGIAHAEDGVTDNEIVIGGVMDLEGRSSGLGQGMKAGIEAALKDQTVEGKKIRFMVANDSYTPDKTKAATETLLADKVLLFAGNVGTPTASVALPLLAKAHVPALGFFTGAGLLRPGEGDIINYRASYVQETKAVIDEALKQGIPPKSVCAYVQNDAYGMAGVKGIMEALKGSKDTQPLLDTLARIQAMPGENPARNGIGPVGVYTRNTLVSMDGYQSLKDWEHHQNTQCKLIVTVGTYDAIGHFIAYALNKGEKWIFSAVSFTGAEDFINILSKFGIHERVIMTQVVPLPDSNLTIVRAAHLALGDAYGYVSQEGFIVGKLLLHGLRKLETERQPITRSALLATFKGQAFDLDGLPMDFTQGNQGSNLVEMTALSGNKWMSLRNITWRGWFE